MDQINTGILKLMNIPGGAHMNGSKADLGANREPTFDVLLEQKNQQARTEVMPERNRKPESSEKETGGEKISEKKENGGEKSEEENYDLAREAAAGQIVWVMAPNAADLRIGEQQENVASIEQPLIIGINDEPGTTVDENALQQIVGDMPMFDEEAAEEIVAVSETVAAPEQTVEAELPQMETNIGEQGAEEPAIEIDVTEGEEVGGEAAVAEKPVFEDVEAAPIKVAEAPDRAERGSEIEKQVVRKLSDVLESGQTKVEIQLEPVELGKLTIELTRSEDGTLNILLNAENAQTRGLLERSMGGLQEALADRGQQSVQITVNQSEESQRQENNDQRNDFQDGSNGRQSEQHRRENQRTGEDFLQQLRLGLIPVEDDDDEED